MFINTIQDELRSLNGFLFRFRRKKKKNNQNEKTMKKNIAEILKYCPEGLPLWSPAYGKVRLEGAFTPECTEGAIALIATHGRFMTNEEGMLCSDGECILFPSKEQRDWDKFWPYEDGDVLYIKTKRHEYVFIYRDKVEEDHVCRYVNLSNWEDLLQDSDGYVCCKSETETIRYATEEETEALYRAIEKEGKIWDPVKKELGNIEIVAAEEKAEKFDINTLKPFDRVLVRDNGTQEWVIGLWAAYMPDHERWKYQCIGCCYDQCVPYKGNEHLFLTKDMPDEYYITWEEEK